MRAEMAGADVVTLGVTGARADDLRLRRVTQAPCSASTHPLALWSRWAWNSDWSWSALGEVKESRGEGWGEPWEPRPMPGKDQGPETQFSGLARPGSLRAVIRLECVPVWV